MVMWSGRDSLLNNIWTYKEIAQTDEKGNLKGTSATVFICETRLLLVQDAPSKQTYFLLDALKQFVFMTLLNHNYE